ncbi:MAG TPA: hypothetical protein VFF06_27550 [Polyangia bacterium]|nr:hypothetical protein [Polyangia bacterium]
MSALAITLIAAGALLMVVACGYALLRQPRSLEVPENDTMAFVLEGPLDGALVRLEGRVVAEHPLTAPSGHAVALYELYASDSDGPARPMRRRAVSFFVDDGHTRVKIDPALDLAAFDLPTSALDHVDGADGVFVERRIELGARVQVVGRILRFGAPGHEEFSLLPADPGAGVALTYLESPPRAARPNVIVDFRARA